MGLEEAFWPKVERGEPDECWPWRGGRSGEGYGVLCQDGDQWYAHRLSLEFDGRKPGDDWALHHCDNPPCVNPNHLYVGTNADNMADASKRHSWPSYNRGEDSGNAKLTEEEVREIRRRYENEDVFQQTLADEFGVSQMSISRVVRGEYWSHVE